MVSNITINKAMILAAGLGTRFKPWTDQHPKALALVNGKTLLQRNIEWLQQYGIRDLIVNVHHFADQVKQAIEQNKGWGSRISISDESNEVLETGGGLKKAAWFFGQDHFVLLNVDILTDLNLLAMMEQHQQNEDQVTLAITNRESIRYFLFNNAGNLCGWRNTKTGEEKGPSLTYSDKGKTTLSQKAFSGIHIINPLLFSHIKQTGKFSMVDVYLDLCSEISIKGFDHSGSKLVDVGRPESVEIAEELFD
jgi:N-acetyl-alpha-D-muramate 1-phosphate uridylyltransferase